ncbi:hypothetical protein ACFXTH_011166 [Malus domestica]
MDTKIGSIDVYKPTCTDVSSLPNDAALLGSCGLLHSTAGHIAFSLESQQATVLHFSLSGHGLGKATSEKAEAARIPTRTAFIAVIITTTATTANPSSAISVSKGDRVAKERFGKLNTVVMNAVVEACVHFGDIDSALMLFDEMAEPGNCGVDTITYGTILKGLGVARRIHDAFYVLESVERGTAVGSPKLSAPLVLGLLNALVEAGDLRRSNGLLHHYGFLLREGGSLTVRVYNLLMKVLLSRRSSSKLISLSSLLPEVVRVYNALLLISFLGMFQNVQLPLKQQGKLL